MAITTSHIISFINLTFSSSPKPSILPQSSLSLSLPTICSTKFPTQIINTTSKLITPVNAVISSSPSTSSNSSNSSSVSSTTTQFYGVCYVVNDEVDTDQIIPSNYCKLNPSNPENFKEIGSYTFSGLPTSYALRFVEENGVKSKYSVIIAGKNFGCGYSKEHAIVALNSAGIKAVIAESYDGSFLEKLNSNGGIYSLEANVRICEEFKTGDVATIDVEDRVLINQTTGKFFQLKM